MYAYRVTVLDSNMHVRTNIFERYSDQFCDNNLMLSGTSQIVFYELHLRLWWILLMRYKVTFKLNYKDGLSSSIKRTVVLIYESLCRAQTQRFICIYQTINYARKRIFTLYLCINTSSLIIIQFIPHKKPFKFIW